MMKMTKNSTRRTVAYSSTVRTIRDEIENRHKSFLREDYFLFFFALSRLSRCVHYLFTSVFLWSKRLVNLSALFFTRHNSFYLSPSLSLSEASRDKPIRKSTSLASETTNTFSATMGHCQIRKRNRTAKESKDQENNDAIP